MANHNSSSDEQSLRLALVEQYKQTESIGLNELSSGNLSCRFGDGMLISPTGATGDNISVDSVVYVSADGNYTGHRKPSSEWQMHAAIYREHDSANAVVHTHSDHCVALSCHNKPLPGFHYLVGTFGGTDVPCVPYATFATMALAESAAAALKKRSACLLGSHGMICRGESLAVAVQLAHRLEIMCRQYLLARQFGEPILLTDDQWKDYFERARLVGYVSQK